MIQAESDSQKRDEFLQRLMELPNQVFCLLDKSFAESLLFYAFEFCKKFWKPSIIINVCTFGFFSPLQKWMEIIGQAHQNVEFLKDQDVIRTVLNILQV